LPDHERTVIRYHYFQRMTVEQTGALIGVTSAELPPCSHESPPVAFSTLTRCP
jgi:hypothetical protein